ncbi:hypothetical protein Tco_0158282 [Tanacetum coccineum]
MEIAPAATSAIPAVKIMEEEALAPERPAAKAKGTKAPTDPARSEGKPSTTHEVPVGAMGKFELSLNNGDVLSILSIFTVMLLLHLEADESWYIAYVLDSAIPTIFCI